MDAVVKTDLDVATNPCDNEDCLRCHPNLKTYKVWQVRTERVRSQVTVHAVDEASAIREFYERTTGPGSYCHDITEAIIDTRPIDMKVDDDPFGGHCYHDYARHKPGCKKVWSDKHTNSDTQTGPRCDCTKT
jgi:hypothetical protein